MIETLLQPLEFHTPVFAHNRPVFPGSPMRLTPFFLQNMKNWHWTVTIQSHTLQYVMAGHIIYTINGKTYEATKGTCFLFRPGQQLDGRSIGPNPVSIFAAHFSRLPELKSRAAVICTSIREITLFESVAEQAVHCRQRNDALSGKHTYASLLQLYCLLEENLERGPVSLMQGRMEELIERIKHHPAGDWRVDIMCEITGLSRSQLTRWFNRLTGIPPNRYVIEKRIARAIQMLGTTNIPVAQIAESLGYRDVPFFIRQFHKETGSSPGALRK